MYRLMIVDDDAIIRRGLSQNIAWAEQGLELVGTAGDGEQGLEMFAQFHPEIVISDIKMPFLDGMGLARRLLNIAPRTKLILLTGYGEFEYAKQALELKIFDYILKPVDLEVLLQTVQRAAAMLEEENKVRWQIEESRPLLQQRFLTRLVEGKYATEEEALAEATFLGMNPRQETFAVIVVKIDEYHNASLFSGVAAQETAKFQIINLCRDIASDQVAVLNPGGDTLVLIQDGQAEAGETTTASLRLG
ncbi:MAG TPA: response regulator, partial [Bacillota bacterium]|nr:response regulator [Bacillota bacterium]